MLLHRIHLNPHCKDARRDLADSYQMHATLCRAFFPPQTKCPPGALLWRLEPETDRDGRPRVLIQCNTAPDWSRLLESGWLAHAEPGINLAHKLSLDTLAVGQAFRFRLRANPCKTVQGKRQGLIRRDAQMEWLQRKADQHGFILPSPETTDPFELGKSPNGRPYPDVRVLRDQLLTGRKPDGTVIRLFAALFEGQLMVGDPAELKAALQTGIGHGKVMGLGLLSIVPTR